MFDFLQVLARSHEKYIFRLQSVRLPDDNDSMGRAVLDPHLLRDLKGRQHTAVPLLASLLFDDSTLFGFVIDRNLLVHLRNNHSLLDDHLQLRSEVFENEAMAALYLNNIVLAVARWLKTNSNAKFTQPQRYFSSAGSKKPLSGPISRKPDIAVLPLVDGKTLRHDSINWKYIHALIEITSTNKFTPAMLNQCLAKRFLMGLYQGDRHFAPCISVAGNRFRLMISDHEGEVQSINHTLNPEGTIIFLRIIVALAFLDAHHIGLDTTMTRQEIKPSHLSTPLERCYRTNWDSLIPKSGRNQELKTKKAIPVAVLLSDGEGEDDDDEDFQDEYIDAMEDDNLIDAIACGGVKYEVIKEIFRAQAFIGRGTRVWLVRRCDNGRRLYVLKESWIPIGQSSEASFLENLEIPNGVRLIANEVSGSTSHIRQDIRQQFQHREKRRIVLEPAGYHLSSIRSAFELLVVARDIVEGKSSASDFWNIDAQLVLVHPCSN